jgi:hypothetical protein
LCQFGTLDPSVVAGSARGGRFLVQSYCHKSANCRLQKRQFPFSWMRAVSQMNDDDGVKL